MLRNRQSSPTQEPDTVPVADETKRAPFFALIIGIDDYQSVRKLVGAAADADMVDKFLQGHLGVPKSRIINLRDKTATREGIIKGFRDLQNHPDLIRDDAIFIYYAGHGSETAAPEGWEACGSKIQVILPQNTGMKDSQDKTIHAIPDRTVAALLNGLAREKGNNITVVFDCCHSSSGTRDDPDVPERVARVATLNDPLPSDLDQEILADQDVGRDIKTPTAFLQRDLRSHVLLAACGAEEHAWENVRLGHGAFTMALLQTLTATGVDKLTYIELMERLPSLPMQNPQCEGHHKDRILFDSKVPGAARSFIRIHQKDKTFTLMAGIAQGITAGSEFTVHADPTLDHKSNPSLCTLRVKITQAITATLEPVEPLDDAAPLSLPKPAYAWQVRCGSGQELRVHFTDAFTRVIDVDAVRRAAIGADEADFVFLVTEAHNAELLVDVIDTENGSRAVFFTTHPLPKEYGFERLPNDVSTAVEDLSHALRSAARWNWHFKRTNAIQLGGTVRLEFTRLKEVPNAYDEEDMPVMMPDGENMNRTGVINMVVDPDYFFGVRIVNETKRDLYPYLFYFDISDQSIEPYYIGPVGKDRVDPPLRAGSSLTVGYGAGGEVPFVFHLRDGEELDVGFLKVFLTTSQTDFGSLKQTSPFEGARAALPKTDVIKKLKPLEHWGTVMATVVQRSTSKPRLEEAHHMG